MNNWIPSTEFEEKVKKSYQIPEVRQEFVQALQLRLETKEPSKSGKSFSVRKLSPAWVVGMFLLTLSLLVTLVVGPQEVWAAIGRLFGYIPGVGLVDDDQEFRVLAEPVSFTRDGITLSVNSAFLTESRTQIDYGISGVPLSAYPRDESVSGCIEPAFLRLPDGTKLESEAPVPITEYEATFVLPCIFNTLPGTVPVDWEIPLRFVAPPPEMTVLPVIDVITPTPDQEVSVVVEKVIQNESGYILIGAVRSILGNDRSISITGVPVLRDANGNKVSYSFPEDINEYDILELENSDLPFSFQFKAAGVAFPLTIEIPGKILTPSESDATAEFAFDAGSNPQPGQEWKLNQKIELSGHTFTLVSITADSRDGYGFHFKTSGEIASFRMNIDGYTPVGGGGGGDNQGLINQSLAFAELPKGNLKIIFSDLILASETQFWQGKWSPENPLDHWPADDLTPASVCLNADSFNQLQPAPVGLEGRALLTILNPEINLVISDLDGSRRQVLIPRGSRGAFSPDGKKVAYSGNDGIVILDLIARRTEPLSIPAGRDLHWSPDGTKIALNASGELPGVTVVSLADNASAKQLSNLGYESLAGWSPDGEKIYYALPSATNDSFLLRSVELQTGITQDLFVLENSSRKAPMPALSPDGRWIVYRASDNSSLYIKGMDGSPARLLLDNPAIAINGLAWGKGSNLIGISLITAYAQDGEVILLKPENCEVQRLSLRGMLDGIDIP